MKKSKTIAFRINEDQYKRLKECEFDFAYELRRFIENVLKMKKCPSCGQLLKEKK